MIRPGGPGDYNAVAQIQAASPEASQWDCAGFELLVAELDGAVVAFLLWRAVADDEAEILNLAVDPAARRRGIARALIAQIDMPKVFLEVRESNRAAQALYVTCGFEQAGLRRDYYQQPVEAAIIMRRDG
jgi:ribosomal-protein-alanine N-acetyltransferase